MQMSQNLFINILNKLNIHLEKTKRLQKIKYIYIFLCDTLQIHHFVKDLRLNDIMKKFTTISFK